MVRGVEVLLLALALGGCAHATGSSRSAARLTYLALGDSYTIGEGVAASERWPVQLAGLLRERGFEIGDPTIVARTGWTTDELAAALPPSGTFDLVTLLIGVNNQYRGRGLDEYREQFVALLERARAFAGGAPGRVVVLSIPDWGVTPFAQDRDSGRIAREIDVFNTVNREETLRAGARYVDVTSISRRHGADRAYLVEDGLHPSGRAYVQWAEAALGETEAALKTPRETERR